MEINMWALVISGLLVGIITGWVLQRGRYCMNSAFRDVIFINDLTLFKAYILALIVVTIGANLLEDLGVIEELRRQAFLPVANIIGGYVFGMGIVLAGGCGSGVWYRVGEGQFNAVVAVLGFMIGIFVTEEGILKPVYDLLGNIGVWKTSEGWKVMTWSQLEEFPGDVSAPTLYDVVHSITGGNPLVVKWVVIGLLAIAGLIFISRGEVQKPKKGYSWPVAGILIGLVVTLAWFASEKWGGGARGVSYTGPTKELFAFLMTGKKPTWGSMLVLGTPIGAFISAKLLNEFKWKAPGVEELLRVFVGGLIMGFGARVGGGCNVGHGITGVSTLALSSLVATIFIILGNWTMVYFLFIKPMKDMDI